MPESKRHLPAMLSPEEIEDLRRDKREANEYCRRAFAHLRPKAEAPELELEDPGEQRKPRR